MRRRVKEDVRAAPPLPLSHYRGSTSREALAWLRGRDEWWNANHDEEDGDWLPWLLDGWEQVGDLPWCGSVAAPCGDSDCMCVLWPEQFEMQAAMTGITS